VTDSLPDAVVAVAYSAALNASGGVPPYDWIVVSGALPPGIELSHDGVFSGTPTTEGDFTFTVQVGSGSGDVDTGEFTITVLPAGSLTIVTSSLPAGEVGKDYSGLIEAVGGTAPYAWSIASGVLPPGLSLDAASGAISGTPSSSGTYLFTARVDDDASGFATRQLSIIVNAETTPISFLKKKSGGCAISEGPSEPRATAGVLALYAVLLLILALSGRFARAAGRRERYIERG
jgi:hypothetical protein